MKHYITCPRCGERIESYRNPVPTVDVIVHCGPPDIQEGVVLIKRRNPPFGWALPGGFVDYGETLEQAALREAREEIGLEVRGLRPFRPYSDPGRDPRQHTISYVFLCRAEGRPRAGDDAADVRIFHLDDLPKEMAFDHEKILSDYIQFLRTGRISF